MSDFEQTGTGKAQVADGFLTIDCPSCGLGKVLVPAYTDSRGKVCIKSTEPVYCTKCRVEFQSSEEGKHIRIEQTTDGDTN